MIQSYENIAIENLFSETFSLISLISTMKYLIFISNFWFLRDSYSMCLVSQPMSHWLSGRERMHYLEEGVVDDPESN